MILTKIYLENWKLFREPFEREFSEGLNILHGPNESGKTTLIDSIRSVFFSKHTSQSEGIRSLIPWGSTLSPHAAITFYQNNDCYRIAKRFVQPRSILEKLVDTKWERIAEGDKADEEVIRLVRGKFPSRGNTKPEFWGLGQALWMVQGQPFISEDLNEETLSSLQRLIGAAIESNEEKELFKNINSRFLSIFTEKRREFRKDSEISSIWDKVGELEKNKEKSERIKEEKEELIRGIEDKEIILQKKKINLDAALKEKHELKGKVDSAYEHKINREKLEEKVKRISFEHEALRKQIGDIKEGKNKIKTLDSENEGMNKEKVTYEKDLGKLMGNIKSLNENMKGISKNIEQRERDRRSASIAHTAVLEELELKVKEELLRKVNELEQEVLKKQRELELLKSPSQKDLKQIEGLYQQIHDTKTKLDAIGLTIEVAAESDVSGKIYLDEESAEFKLKKGESDTWKSHQSVRMQIDKVGELEIKSGSEDVRKMKADLEEVEIVCERTVAPYETKSLEELRGLLHQKEGLEKEVKRLREEIEKQAKNGKETLIREIAEWKRRIESNWNKIPESSEFRKYAESKDKAAAREELSKKINEIEEEIENIKTKKRGVEKELEDWKQNEEGVRGKIRELEKDIHGNSERMKEIKNVLDDLQKDGLSFEGRGKKLNEISLELDKKERALEGYKDEVEEIEEKPIRDLKECESRVERLQEDIHKLENGIAEANGRLNAILANLKDTNKIEEELEFLRDREQRLETEAYAVELLSDLMHFYRSEAIRNLTEPVQKMVTEDLKRVVGTKYAVKFDEGVKPVSVGVSKYKTEALIDDLSFGTEEQIWYLFRLALGRLLSSEERQLVVLDDPLANTDPSRLHRALQILEEAAKKLQIIVVTCDVDKYNWLPTANFVPLES